MHDKWRQIVYGLQDLKWIHGKVQEISLPTILLKMPSHSYKTIRKMNHSHTVHS